MSICTCTPKQKDSGRFSVRCTAHHGHSTRAYVPRRKPARASAPSKAASETWTRFQAAYLENDESIEGINAYMATWDAFKTAVGNAKALREYWRWMATLPRPQRSDVDPDGGC